MTKGNEVYCRECGAKIKDNAEICVKCGVRQKSPTTTKSKTAALVLAVLLGQWTWVYTYKYDAWKFWIALLTNFIGLFMFLIPNVAVWIWSIVDQASKPDDFWENY